MASNTGAAGIGGQSAYLFEAMKGGLYCDMKLNCKGTIIPVHKVVMCTQSPVIDRQINGFFEVSCCVPDWSKRVS